MCIGLLFWIVFLSTRACPGLPQLSRCWALKIMGMTNTNLCQCYTPKSPWQLALPSTCAGSEHECVCLSGSRSAVPAWLWVRLWVHWREGVWRCQRVARTSQAACGPRYSTSCWRDRSAVWCAERWVHPASAWTRHKKLSVYSDWGSRDQHTVCSLTFWCILGSKNRA